MRVFRPTWKRDGKTREGTVYWVSATVNGSRLRKTTGCRDKRAAEERAREIVRHAERKAAGLIDPWQEQQERPLAEHVADFETTLRARNLCAQHIADRTSCLQKFVDTSKARRLSDLDEVKASRWLEQERLSGLAARTVNRRYQALRQFGRWLTKTKRVASDPFEGLCPLNEAADRRHVRRALNADELSRLLEAAERRPLENARAQRTTCGVTPVEEARLKALGASRALLYDLAAGTGLRKGELKRCCWRDLDFERRWVTVPAASAKSRKLQGVPLRQDLVIRLQAHRPKDAVGGDLVFPGASFPSLRAFKRDLVAAGLALVERRTFDESGERYKQPREIFDTEDDSGRRIDFHSLRYTFVTRLAQAGVHPRAAQELARHAKIETTMEIYTDLSLLDLHGAVEQAAGPDLLGHMLGQKPASTTDNASSRRTKRVRRWARKAARKRATNRPPAREVGREEVVGVTGLEPVTPSLSSWCSSQLS